MTTANTPKRLKSRSKPAQRKATTRKPAAARKPRRTATRARPAKTMEANVAGERPLPPFEDTLPPPRPVPEILQRPYKSLKTREEKWEWHKALASLEPETPRFHGVISIDGVAVWRGLDIEEKYKELKASFPNRKISLAWIDTAPIVIYTW